MIESFLEHLSINCNYSPGKKYLLAVSGGVDSMVMTHLYYRAGIEFGIAHCNFNLRGDESDGDEDFVTGWSNERSIPFHIKRFETKLYSGEHGVSTQMAARELRYEWFEEVRNKEGYDYIALAHNLNDNIETFLLNLTRGTGITGLSGIKALSGKLVRPLLPFTRNEITAYREEYEVPFREDSSNAETKYIRNNVRHNIIPLLNKLNPSFDRTLASTIGILTDIGEVYFAHVEKVRKRLLKPTVNGFTIKLKDLNLVFRNQSVAFELLRPFGVNRSQLDDIQSIAGGVPGKMVITNNYRLIADREVLIIEPFEEKTERREVIENPTSLARLYFIENVEIIENHGAYTPPSSSEGAAFDGDKITFPLVIRNWQKGDSFIPLGMKGKKKLSDFFIDKKIAITEKDKVRIMEINKKIAWVIGHRIDNRFRVTEETKRIMIITLLPKPGHQDQ